MQYIILTLSPCTNVPPLVTCEPFWIFIAITFLGCTHPVIIQQTKCQDHLPNIVTTDIITKQTTLPAPCIAKCFTWADVIVDVFPMFGQMKQTSTKSNLSNMIHLL